MSAHLPVLQVIVPLLSAPVCVLLGRAAIARFFSILATWVTAAIAIALLWQVRDGSVISYPLGGWAAPWGIEYRVDRLNAFVLVVVTTIAAAALPAGEHRTEARVQNGSVHLFCAAYLLCLTGLAGMAITGDLFNVFVFLEISSLSSYTLVSTGQHRRALTSAFNYLVMGTIGGTFILLGIGLLYQATGSLNMADIAERLNAVRHSRTVTAAFAFLIVGAGIKLAVFPLHQWLPNAYTYAPPAVSAFLAGTATKVIYYFTIRVVFTIFGPTFVFQTLHFREVALPAAIAAMFIGSLAAVYQTNIKRLLAYSSVAQIGYLTLGLSLGTVSGLAAGLIHLFNHAFLKAALFLAVACLAARVGSDSIDDFSGIGRKMPISMGAFVVAGLGIIGVPATAGFVSKWHLVLAALDVGSYALAALILLSSMLAVLYVWKVVEVAYFRAPANDAQLATEAPASILIPTCLVAGATVYFGVYWELPVSTAMAAAAQLFPGAAP